MNQKLDQISMDTVFQYDRYQLLQMDIYTNRNPMYIIRKKIGYSSIKIFSMPQCINPNIYG